jgi:2-polyprenyl-3-methyl-5-hydroxy-6-metoxy-1,4-benzoquinol methylase
MNEIDKETLKKEAEAFDKQVDERIKNGFIPDLRRLKRVEWFYNNVWREPEFVEIHMMPKINFVIERAKKHGGKVLEIGCGHGYLTLELARNGLDVVGVDLSPKSIEIAERFAKENTYKDTFGSLKYTVGDIMSLDLGIEEYDTIIFFGTLHHIPNIDQFLPKIHQALKIDGAVIACEPIRENISKENIELAAMLKAILPTHVSFDEKLKGLDNEINWQKYVGNVFDEYSYTHEHEQSPCDNVTASEKVMLEGLGKLFNITDVEYSDAFIDKIIGSLRGENRFVLAKFLKFLDDEMIKTKKLLPGAIRVYATKKLV